MDFSTLLDYNRHIYLYDNYISMHYREYIHITMEQALYPRAGWKPTKGGMEADQGRDGIMSRYLKGRDGSADLVYEESLRILGTSQ